MTPYDAIFVTLAERLVRENGAEPAAGPVASEVELLRTGLTRALLDLDMFETLLAVLPEAPAGTGGGRASLPVALKDEMLAHGLNNLTPRQLVQLATHADWLATMKCELETNAPLHWTTIMAAVFPGHMGGADRREPGSVDVPARPPFGPTPDEPPPHTRSEVLPPVPPFRAPHEWAEPKPSRRSRAVGALTLVVGIAASLIVGILLLTSNLQPVKAEEDKKVVARKVEDGKKDAEVASEMKARVTRLKIEIRRRLQMPVRGIQAKPHAGSDGEVLNRGTLFYEILCMRGPNPDREGRAEWDVLSSTFSEYTHDSTLQLCAQLVLNSQYPEPVDPLEKAEWQNNRNVAKEVSAALDTLAVTHLGFSHAKGAKAFEADILKRYPALISKLDPTPAPPEEEPK